MSRLLPDPLDEIFNEEKEEDEEESEFNCDFNWFSQGDALYESFNVSSDSFCAYKDSVPLDSSVTPTLSNLDYRFTTGTFKSGIPNQTRESINAKIAEWSKGSSFYENEKRKNEAHELKIQKLLKQVAMIEKSDLIVKEKEVDRWINELENERDLNSIIVLMDLDAFYASVEERDRPELKNVPMAVGNLSMLSTSNYVARKFGVRSGMPGYLAKKLCPALVIVPLHFQKYKLISQKVFSIQKEYDVHAQSWGLDETYLNLTEYMKQYLDKNVDEVVNEIRRRIFESVQITASAGIACNRLLAKICADMNKPNGQYLLESKKDTILSFLSNLPIRKVFGVGRVMEHTLKALGVTTCSDFLNHRALLSMVLSPKTFQFLLLSSLGLVKNKEEIDSNELPKSISSERTIRPANDTLTLLSILETITQDVASQLQRKGWVAKHVTLKCKSIHFRVKQMGQLQSKYIQCVKDVFQAASKFLQPLLNSLDNTPLRLIGVRVSHLQLASNLEVNSIQHFFKKAVQCPVCNQSVHEAELNVHLDLCLFLFTNKDSMIDPDETTKKLKQDTFNSNSIVRMKKQATIHSLSPSASCENHKKKKRKKEILTNSLDSFLKIETKAMMEPNPKASLKGKSEES